MSINEVSAWLDALPGNYTIQRLRSGKVMMSLQMGGQSTSAIRDTFEEAAKECLISARATLRVNRV